MTTELWIALLTFLTSAAGVARWIVHVYWRQAEMIEDLRNSNSRQSIARLEETVSDHKKVIEGHQSRLIEVQDRLLKIQAVMTKNSQDSAMAIKMLHDTIETTASKFKKYETDLIALSKNLVLVKGRGGGKNN